VEGTEVCNAGGMKGIFYFSLLSHTED